MLSVCVTLTVNVYEVHLFIILYLPKDVVSVYEPWVY